MHVLFLADAVLPDMPGGSKRVAWHLAQGLHQRGHHVTFLVPAHGTSPTGAEDCDGVRVIRYPHERRPDRFLRAGHDACGRLWAEERFDLVHTHFAYAALGPLRAVPSGVPVVRTFHGFWDQEGWVQETATLSPRRPGATAAAPVRRLVRALIEAHDLRRSAAVVVLSEFSGSLLHARGVPPGRIHLIPPGVDADRFRPAAPLVCRASLRESLGLPTSRRLLLSVRRLVPRMGLDRLVRAMPAVVACYPDALLLIGGQGPERARLEHLVAGHGLQDHVRMLGFIPDDALTAHYQAADLFVLPTAALEGFGLVTLEALACGTPAVGTPVGATPEILASLDPRLIARDATPAALADAITGALAGVSLPPDRLHAFVGARYSWEMQAARTERLYATLCAAGPSRPWTRAYAEAHGGRVSHG